MVELDRIGRGISIGIRKRWFVERGRSRSRRGCRNDKSLDAKSTDEYLRTDAEPVRLNIALIPCKAEWGLGYLNYKEIEVSVGGQTTYRNVHSFHWTDGFDCHAPARVRQKVGECSVKSWVSHHVEFEFLRESGLLADDWRRCKDTERHSTERDALHFTES